MLKKNRGKEQTGEVEKVTDNIGPDGRQWRNEYGGFVRARNSNTLRCTLYEPNIKNKPRKFVFV